MKHTDYQTEVYKIRNLERIELMRALEAHGGSYEWGEGDCCPIIAVNPDSSEPEPEDVRVTKVAIIDGSIEIYGVDNKHGEPVDFGIGDIFVGHVSFITDCIPETKEVSDVSISCPINCCKSSKNGKIRLSNTESDEEKDVSEVIADLAYEAGNAGYGKDTDSREVNQTIIHWAKEFLEKHKNTDWYKIDYLEEILRFSTQKIKVGNVLNAD